jgi:hypothetical protein
MMRLVKKTLELQNKWNMLELQNKDKALER